jgi:dipeptidyl aminopeptidase/acylaminoacyl peptidase
MKDWKQVLPWVLTACVGAGLALPVAVRNYRAAHSLIEADPPSAILGAPQQTGIAGLRSVSFGTPDHLELSGWYRPPTRGAVIIITHGTNTDRSSMLPELRLLTDAGYGVLAFDWPGLGDSRGRIRWDGQARRALTAAIDWVAAQPGVDSARIAGLGFSIGAYVMAQVAAHDARLRAVVLEAAPPDFEDYIRLHYRHWWLLSELPARWALRDTGLLDNAAAAVNVIQRIGPRPLLMLGGSADQEVSPELVRKLYAAAYEPKTLWIVEGAHHGGYSEVAAPEYARRLTDFYAASLQGRDHDHRTPVPGTLSVSG